MKSPPPCDGLFKKVIEFGSALKQIVSEPIIFPEVNLPNNVIDIALLESLICCGIESETKHLMVNDVSLLKKLFINNESLFEPENSALFDKLLQLEFENDCH